MGHPLAIALAFLPTFDFGKTTQREYIDASCYLGHNTWRIYRMIVHVRVFAEVKQAGR
jgi:hypothetical protein